MIKISYLNPILRGGDTCRPYKSVRDHGQGIEYPMRRVNWTGHAIDGGGATAEGNSAKVGKRQYVIQPRGFHNPLG